MLIVLDGIDGSGKTTQARLLLERMKGESIPCVVTREPGGCPEAERIRKHVLSEEGKLLSKREQFDLFWEARKHFVQQVVRPALKRGEVVISDRFDSSTFAYQAFGDTEMVKAFWEKRREVIGFDLTEMIRYFIFDLPVQEAFSRTHKDSKRDLNHFDEQSLESRGRVRAGFLRFFNIVGGRPSVLVDARKSEEEVHADIWARLRPIIPKGVSR